MSKFIGIRKMASQACPAMITFNNGQHFPVLGLGTWQSKTVEACRAVRAAIDIGYRHIDCAHVYGNEVGVGRAIKAKIKDGTVKSEELYITSKLWCNAHRPDLVEPALKKTLKNLQREQLELYLMHWPFAFQEGDRLSPTNPDGTLVFSDVDYVDTWKVMEELAEKHFIKSIGVSNFNQKQVTRLLKYCKIVPVTNQIENHPFLTQKKLVEFCKSKKIAITAYSPLGSPGSPYFRADLRKILENCEVITLAAKYKKTPAQILIRYQIQKGHIVIPKSVTKSRIEENFDVWDFDMTLEEIDRLDNLDRNQRSVTFLETRFHRHYPFKQGPTC